MIHDRAGNSPRPLRASAHPLGALNFASGGKTYDLPDYLALNRVVGLLILEDGRVVFEDYEHGVTPKTRWMSMSLAKSIVSTLVGAAVEDGFIASIQDPVTHYLPQLMRSLPRATEPGKTFKYSTGETVLVGEMVQAATRKPLAEYLSKKIWVPLGMESDASWWLDSPDGHEVGGSGVLATLRDFGRFGQFILDGARIDGKRIVPDGWLIV